METSICTRLGRSASSTLLSAVRIGGMVAAEREHPEAAQQIEIAAVLAVVEVLAPSLAKADIIPDGPQHPDHLLIDAPGMKVKTLRFMGLEQACNVKRAT